MDPRQHDDARRSEDPFSIRTDKTLTGALDALFFVTIAKSIAFLTFLASSPLLNNNQTMQIALVIMV
jgi:hypothetical protein